MEDCCICYEATDASNMIIMKCCNNSKQICVDCINCLRTPLCPYCRTPLNEELLQQNKNIVRSLPHSYTYQNTNLGFDSFLQDEYYINPNQYNDSRRLRRQIRRLRYEYLQQQTRNNPYRLTSRQRREERRNNRQSIRQQLRDYQNNYNHDDDFRYEVQDNETNDDDMGFVLEM